MVAKDGFYQVSKSKDQLLWMSAQDSLVGPSLRSIFGVIERWKNPAGTNVFDDFVLDAMSSKCSLRQFLSRD